MRIAVFGDLSGHFSEFKLALENLGVQWSGQNLAPSHWPHDLQVVQVGDLVHRGPDSDLLVKFVWTLLDHCPAHYYQLVGNHEGIYLGGPAFGPPNPSSAGFFISSDSVSALRGLWKDRKIFASIVVQDEVYGDILVTHAGCTYDLWASLNLPTAKCISRSLNSMPPKELFKAGVMLSGVPKDSPGVTWALAGAELYPSWVNSSLTSMPFHQLHGHSSCYYWSKGEWSPSPISIRKYTTIDKVNRHSKFTLGEKYIWGIDQGLGKYPPHFLLAPKVFSGKVVLSY